MEMQFEKTICACLAPVVQEVQNQESTQEIKLSDGMPDIGRVIGSWGQVILRGKEWRGDCIALTGGVMAWVLYAPEDGSTPRCLDTWIPIQMKWDLPDGAREGEIRVSCLLRSVDARSVSPRKLMVRAGVAALGQAMSPMEAEVFHPEALPGDVELLKHTYPVRLHKEAGEKTFLLDEELTLPASCPAPEKLLCYQMQPQVTDQKVMANKVVFRGNGNLHVLYASEEGQLFGWDFELPFSQFAELTGEYSTDARAEISLCVTSLDLELDTEGHLRLKAGLVAQHLVDDRENLELTEDAYSTGRDVEVKLEALELPAVLDSRGENLYGEQTIPADANVIVDSMFLPDFPRQRKMDTGIRLEMPGQFQVLYYAGDGSLHSGTARWEGSHQIGTGEDCRLLLDVSPIGRPQVTIGDGTLAVKGELQLKQLCRMEQGIPMAAALQLGEQRSPDPTRPSVILRRVREERLWDIAKGCGSTVRAIRQANGIQDEPAENQMLLIPVI